MAKGNYAYFSSILYGVNETPGAGDYWDDVDRWIRNQFAEGQLLRSDWLYELANHDLIAARHINLPPSLIYETYETVERVPERNIGAFADWPSANDFYNGHGVGIMHCCTGNGATAIYCIWETILNYEAGKLQVNLLLNRVSPWVDVNSYIPYEGQVDVKIKQACELSIRIPEWVTPKETVCRVNDAQRSLDWNGRYAKVGSLKPGNVAVLTFPIEERRDVVYIERQRYVLIRKGNDVVYIDPPGRNCPLYQRTY